MLPRHASLSLLSSTLVLSLVAPACTDSSEPALDGSSDGSSSGGSTMTGPSSSLGGTADESTSSGSTEGSTSGADSSTTEPETTTGEIQCEFSEVGEVVPVGDGCCGCLCGDTGWSCSADTCLEPDGTATGLLPEAGFIELAPHPYSSAGFLKSAPRSRVWYSFWPADDEPQTRPLVLLFNGGPGTSTGILFGGNTAPYSLDPQRTESIEATAQPWTQAANLLYVDAPSTGFSYNLPIPGGFEVPIAIDSDYDASAFITVLLRFLARHPSIQTNPVVILGESYGGTRGMLMLHQLLDYEGLLGNPAIYENEVLYEEIRRHLAVLYPETCGEGLTREQIATQFGHLVTVQGLVAGSPQTDAVGETSPSCIPDGDQYHCDRPANWFSGIQSAIGDRLRQPELLSTALGVDPTTIAWMHADAREGAYGRTVIADESAMTSVFGMLDPGDAYYVEFNDQVFMPQPSGHLYWMAQIADVFLDVVATTDTLMTDARLDTSIMSHALGPVLEARDHAVASAVYDDAPRPGVQRPGWLQLEYVPGWAPDGVRSREIRMPRYDQAGHATTLDEPEMLLDDLMTWLNETL